MAAKPCALIDELTLWGRKWMSGPTCREFLVSHTERAVEQLEQAATGIAMRRASRRGARGRANGGRRRRRGRRHATALATVAATTTTVAAVATAALLEPSTAIASHASARAAGTAAVATATAVAATSVAAIAVAITGIAAVVGRRVAAGRQRRHEHQGVHRKNPFNWSSCWVRHLRQEAS